MVNQAVSKISQESLFSDEWKLAAQSEQARNAQVAMAWSVARLPG